MFNLKVNFIDSKMDIEGFDWRKINNWLFKTRFKLGGLCEINESRIFNNSL